MGPIYHLGGQGRLRQRHLCLHLAGSHRMDQVSAGRTSTSQPKSSSTTPANWPAGGQQRRTLSRVTRLFQPRLFQRLFQRPTDLRQELARSTRGWAG